MAKAIALVITGIAIALLVIYGADAAAGAGNPDHQGFLDMDHKTRGYGLGGPAMILPIIAYFISRDDSSKGLGGMIIISGILIIIGHFSHSLKLLDGSKLIYELNSQTIKEFLKDKTLAEVGVNAEIKPIITKITW